MWWPFQGVRNLLGRGPRSWRLKLYADTPRVGSRRVRDTVSHVGSMGGSGFDRNESVPTGLSRFA